MELNQDNLSELEKRLEHTFQDREILFRALTHKSYSHESRGARRKDNETFEFLGDSVLGFVIGDLLFKRFPELHEGELSKMKSYLVSLPVLTRLARNSNMGECLLLGVGEEKSGGRNKESLLGNLFEAVIAALYLDGGITTAQRFIETSFAGELDRIDQDDLLFHDYKTALQEVAQARGFSLPEYMVLAENGPDHAKRFVIEVRLADSLTARGEGSSKKEAQQNAAQEALRACQSLPPRL